MTDSDFDFDFDVNRGRSGGTSPREEAPQHRTSNGRRANGRGRDGPDSRGNGAPAAPTALDESGPPRGRLVYRDREEAVPDPPLEEPLDLEFRPPPRRRPPAPPPADELDLKPAPWRESAPTPEPSPDGDDWLELGEDLGGPGLETLTDYDGGPAGPRTLREGRNLAREARRRATRRRAAAQREGLVTERDQEPDFETMLKRQPQRSAVAKGGSAVIYALRGLLDGGRERLRESRYRLEELRERVSTPGTLRPHPGDGKPPPPRLPKRIGSRRPRRPEPGRIRKFRLLLIVLGLGLLAMVSTVFGMMISVAGDLPQLENKQQYAAAQNSEVYDSEGRKIGTLLSNNQRILVESGDISPYIKQAVVAIEDERFYEHRGVDFLGIARAIREDLLPGGSTQGGSTITMQFVKNALEAQGNRTVFQKLREAALAYHLERQWDKDKILTQYLNTIYFGEGAYGIEAAARTYFGWNHQGCGTEGGDLCASELRPEEAALLAAIISAPGAASPRADPAGATERRNLVLDKMNEQGVLSDQELEDAKSESVPAASNITKPPTDSLSPYFTDWLRQQVVDLYGAGKAFSGGLDVHTTIDLDIQEEAEGVAYNMLSGIEPTASVVVLDNATGGVRAMVGGSDFQKRPFNLATNGQRQPGSAFKPFTLVSALEKGISPSTVYASQPKEFKVPNSGGKEIFRVENYEDKYLGSASIATATQYSDNSVYAELGIEDVGTKRIANTAERMGIRTNVSENPAITLGAPKVGFTPLEMAYSFLTLSHDGERVGGNLDSAPGRGETPAELGPVGMTRIVGPDGDVEAENKTKTIPVLSEEVAETAKDILESVIDGGTGESAETGGYSWGKTGTTENNGDAWFCGGTEHFTACVWVGHAQTNTPMETEFRGLPVDGGTYPALIWAAVMRAAEAIYEERQAEKKAEKEERQAEKDSQEDEEGDSGYSDYDSGSGGDSSSGGGGGGGNRQSAPAPAPSGGGGGGSPGGVGGSGL